MKIDWSPLEQELAQCRSTGMRIPLWWRDDDAVADTPALHRLAELSSATGLPVHLAVIPALIAPTLPPMIAENPLLVPVVHGWRHISHAPAGEKNAEFGHTRPNAGKEMAQSLAQMHRHFGTRLVKIFVPPWNRITLDLLPDLRTCGYKGLSTYGPRKTTQATTGIVQINTHIDPIFWRGHRGLVAPEDLVAGIVSTLQDRREGRSDATEPLGLLTHHLVHTEDVWAFSREVVLILLDGGASPAEPAELL